MIIALSATVLASCSQEKAPSENTSDTIQTTETQKGMVVVDLMPYGLGAQLTVPGRERTGVDPTITMDDVTSHVDIRSGKNYHIVLREEPVDLSAIRMDLEEDIMFVNEVVIEEPNNILYRRTLPDGSESFHHFATVIGEGDERVVLKSHQMGKFTKIQAQRMMESSLTLERQAPLAQK